MSEVGIILKITVSLECGFDDIVEKRKGVDSMKYYADNSTDRQVYFDYLRVFATFAVMILHISAQNWYTTDVNDFAWKIFNFTDSVVRWCVPVFVMISGSLFLNRDIPLRKMYSKYILRMVTAFIVWSLIYAFFVDGTISNKISAFVRGHYHMWFILMISGIYMCMPFIKPIVETEKRLKYYLFLSFVFAFLIPEFVTLTIDFGNESIIKGADAINTVVNTMDMRIVLGYISYFVLGYLWNKIELNKRQRILIYILGIIGFAFTIVVDYVVAIKTQTCCGNYYGNFNVNVLFEALAVFTWFKYQKYEKSRLNIFIQRLSKYSFGAYLVHALIIDQLNIRFGINTLSFTPVVSVVLISVIVFILSFSISAILNKIPVLKKYIV